MKPQIKQKWLHALRSGEYKQGFAALHLNDKFCCLGVLCDLHAKETHGEWVKENDCDQYSYYGAIAYIPYVVAEWAGITEIRPSIQNGISGVYRLDKLNDDGHNFNSIADLIEKDL